MDNNSFGQFNGNAGDAGNNGQMPQMQPLGGMVGNMQGMPANGTQLGGPGQPYAMGPMGPIAEAPAVKPHADISDLIKTIVIVVLFLTAMAFIGLFIWRTGQYETISADVAGQVNEAVASAVMEQAEKDEAEFAEREKFPYRTFSGPADYGQLTFEYPKTWSVYVAADASRGGDYEAYLNPIEVQAVANDTINALRVIIRDRAYDDMVEEYQRYLDAQDASLGVESITVGGTAANRYVGKIPGTELSGIIVIFKIRDKTAILQTDSVLFEEDFNRLIQSVTFNA